MKTTKVLSPEIWESLGRDFSIIVPCQRSLNGFFIWRLSFTTLSYCRSMYIFHETWFTLNHFSILFSIRFYLKNLNQFLHNSTWLRHCKSFLKIHILLLQLFYPLSVNLQCLDHTVSVFFRREFICVMFWHVQKRTLLGNKRICT